MMNLLRDIRYSARSLWKSRGFSLAVIATLALCTGANAAVLSALYSLVLKPLPVENPEQLLQVFNIGRNNPLGSGSSGSSWTQYLDFRKRTDLFEGCALRKPATKIVSRHSSGRKVKGQSITADFFDLMGATPLLGRFFIAEEVDPLEAKVLVLTQSEWENEYDSDPNVIGQQIALDDRIHYTIIGVAPRSMEAFDFEAKFFIPFEFDSRTRSPEGRYGGGADLWVRLKQNVSREASLGQLRAMERRWYEEEADAKSRRHYEAVFKRIELGLAHPLQASLSLLEGGALFVLLVGCLNVVTLFLIRAAQKCHELSVRNALGASKFTLSRLLFIESALLTAVATGGGMMLALGGLRVINQYLVVLDPSAMPIALDMTVLSSILVVAVGVALLMGLLPMELLWRTGLLQRVDSSPRTASAGGFAQKLSNVFVVGQVAAAFALLIGASLLFRSFHNVLAVDPGFDATRIVKARIDYETLGTFYKRGADTAALKQRVVAGMKEIPGVQSVSLSQYESFMPYNGENMRGFVIRGAPADASEHMVRHLVSPDYFTTMGISILEGREFHSGDTKDAVYVVDEVFARRFFKDRSAVGSEIFSSNKPPRSGVPWSRIVGVAARANLRGLEQRDGLPVVYTVMDSQKPSWSFTVLLRTSRSPENVIKEMRAKVREIDPRLPLSKVSTLQESLDGMLLGRKGITLLFGVFASLSLFLSAIGIYGVLAYNVQQRRREFGIRSALGAGPDQLLAMVLRQGFLKASLGLGLGLIGSLYLSRFLESQLFDITTLDPWAYGIALGFLLLVALAASYLPARRAITVDPVEALRAE